MEDDLLGLPLLDKGKGAATRRRSVLIWIWVFEGFKDSKGSIPFRDSNDPSPQKVIKTSAGTKNANPHNPRGSRLFPIGGKKDTPDLWEIGKKESRLKESAGRKGKLSLCLFLPEWIWGMYPDRER